MIYNLVGMRSVGWSWSRKKAIANSREAGRDLKQWADVDRHRRKLVEVSSKLTFGILQLEFDHFVRLRPIIARCRAYIGQNFSKFGATPTEVGPISDQIRTRQTSGDLDQLGNEFDLTWSEIGATGSRAGAVELCQRRQLGTPSTQLLSHAHSPQREVSAPLFGQHPERLRLGRILVFTWLGSTRIPLQGKSSQTRSRQPALCARACRESFLVEQSAACCCWGAPQRADCMPAQAAHFMPCKWRCGAVRGPGGAYVDRADPDGLRMGVYRRCSCRLPLAPLPMAASTNSSCRLSPRIRHMQPREQHTHAGGLCP